MAPTKTRSIDHFEGPVSASWITHAAAERPQGGKRRAAVPTHGVVPEAGPGPACGGRRARRDDAVAVLINAADAANHLSMCSRMWGATQILAHIEIAHLAMVEALQDLDAERTDVDVRLGTGRRRHRERVAAHEDIQRRTHEVLRAVEFLDAAHAQGLVSSD